MSMIIDPNGTDFSQYLEEISFLESQSIKDVTNFLDDANEYALAGDALVGATLPWSKLEDITRIGDGKLSIWAGANGSGKSQLLGQVINGLMLQGRKACIASLEMKPGQTIYRMASQSAGCKAGTQYMSAWAGYFTGRLCLYDQLDRIAANRILGMVHYAANELHAQDIVVDSLTKCGVGREDYTAQAQFVDRLQWCAKRYNVHIHMVCHMRKSGDQAHRNGKNDIRGAAEITDLADNVFILQRNKAKEAEVEKRDAGVAHDADAVFDPCAYLSVEKNRDYGHEKTLGLWFDHSSGQFTESDGMRYAPLEVRSGS